MADPTRNDPGHRDHSLDYNDVADRHLRKWCLEEAIKRRDMYGPGHLVVTNVAAEYFNWVTKGVSQGSLVLESVMRDLEKKDNENEQ